MKNTPIRLAETGEPIKRFDIIKGRVDEHGEVTWPDPTDRRQRNTELFGRGSATFDTSSPGWKLRILAQGYEPLETRTLKKDEGRVRLELKLEPLEFGEGGGPSGVVVDAQGKPLAGAAVMLNGFGNPAEIEQMRAEMASDNDVDVAYDSADMTRRDDIMMMVERAQKRFGQIDSSLSRKYEGTGLGLPLAKRLVELHGGTLELESTVGVGTRVSVLFPHQRIVETLAAA